MRKVISDGKEAKDKYYIKRAASKLISDYENKHEICSCSVYEDQNLHLPQFNIVCYEYNTDPKIWLRAFAQSYEHTSKAYHYLRSLKGNQVLAWSALSVSFLYIVTIMKQNDQNLAVKWNN